MWSCHRQLMPVVLKTKEEARVCVTSTSVRWDHFYWLVLQFLCTCSHSHILSACQLPYSPLGLHVFLPSFLQQMLMGLANTFCLPHVLLPVSQWVRFFFFFSKASFYFCLSRSLDLSHIKSLLHVFSFGSSVSSMQRTCPVQQNYAFIRLLQHCLCNHFAELCYSWFYLATWYA